MADKGFDIKVLIPTDDGITISDKRIENARYFLLYNLSNRSYQLAGKLNVEEFINEKEELTEKLHELMLNEKIDRIVIAGESSSLDSSFIQASESEIENILNELIDMIEKNELI